MDGSTQRTAYRAAFEHAQAVFHQLNLEVNALDHRRTALISATKALEVMIKQRTEPQTASEVAAVVEINRIAAAGGQSHNRPSTDSLTQTYAHRDLPNEIQRRIDLAIGR